MRWAVRAAAPGAGLEEIRGLRDGGAPWLFTLNRGGDRYRVVLRVGDPADASPLRTEVAALQLAGARGIPAPRLVAADLAGDPPRLLTGALAGSSTIPPDRPGARLRALGAAAAALHAVSAEAGKDLPWRDRPIPGEDFAAIRREQPDPLLAEAEQRVAESSPDGVAGFVHGDLWQGNVLWDGEVLVGLVDWDCAGVGPAGVDLGSLRCDAAVCFGPDAAEDVRRGWEDAAGQVARDVPYWDAVACLSTPVDMGWFAGAIAGQGRPDLSRQVLRERRDAFLASTLQRWDRG